MVDNDILSLEQPPEEADWTEREKRRRKKMRKTAGLGGICTLECEEETARFFQSIRIVFGARKESGGRKMNHASVRNKALIISIAP